MFPNWYRCFQVDNVSKLCFQINYYLLFWSINGPWFSDQPLFQPFVPVRYRGTTGETLKVACRPCYERFRAKQAGKDVCQFCWRCIEREERHLKIRYKVEKYFYIHLFFRCSDVTCLVFTVNLTQVRSGLENRHLWSDRKNRFLSELINITLLSITLYTICWIEGF